MPKLQPPESGNAARKRFHHRHYYPLQFPGNLLSSLMKAAVSLGKHPDQVVGTAVQRFLALSAEEQRRSLAAFERYAPFGQDTPGNEVAAIHGTGSIPSGRFPKDRWQRYWLEWIEEKQSEQMPLAGSDETPVTADQAVD